MNDKEFLKTIQEHGLGAKLKLAKNEYEEFDAFDDNTIVEFKHRGQDYAEYLIEGTKMLTNYHYAQKVGKKFFFVVITPKRLIVWDVGLYLMKTENSKYDKRPGKIMFTSQLLPTNQHRGDTHKINKFIHYIPVVDAIKVVRLKTK